MNTNYPWHRPSRKVLEPYECKRIVQLKSGDRKLKMHSRSLHYLGKRQSIFLPGLAFEVWISYHTQDSGADYLLVNCPDTRWEYEEKLWVVYVPCGCFIYTLTQQHYSHQAFYAVP